MDYKDENKILEGAEEKLVYAALDLFAKNGFDGTSTRTICKKAGVNIALIPYYFSNKYGLYQAAIKMLAEIVFKQMKPVLKKINNIQNNTKEENVSLLHELIEHFAEFALNTEMPKSIVLLVIREQLEPTPAFEILYNTSMKHVYGSFKKLIAAILNKEVSEPEITYRTSTFVGQIMSFRMAREATLRSLGRDNYTKQDIHAIKQIIISQVDAILKTAGENT